MDMEGIVHGVCSCMILDSYGYTEEDHEKPAG